MSDQAVSIGVPAAGAASERRWISHSLQHAAVFVAVIALWEASVQFGWVSKLLLPSPFAVVAAWYNLAIASALIWPHFFVTMFEALAGFFIGVVLGGGAAIACALSPPFRRLASPYMVALQVTPRIAIAPIIVAWLGFGMEPKIAIAMIICFFPIFINTLTGLLQTDADAHEMFRSLRASKRQIFMELMLPGAMPVIMAGCKTGISLALIGAIVGEFVSASVGMGVLIQRFSFQLLLPEAFACLLMLTVMGLILFFAMELLDSRLVFWRHDKRLAEKSRRKAARYHRRA